MLQIKLFYSKAPEGDASIFKADFQFNLLLPQASLRDGRVVCSAKNGFRLWLEVGVDPSITPQGALHTGRRLHLLWTNFPSADGRQRGLGFRSDWMGCAVVFSV